MSIQHPEMTSAVACDPARLLDELKRIAVEQLGAVPGGLYRPIEEQLHESLRGGNEGAHRKDLMTVLALRQRGSGYVMKFRELIGRSFDDFCGLSTPGRSHSPLGLVREGAPPPLGVLQALDGLGVVLDYVDSPGPSSRMRG